MRAVAATTFLITRAIAEGVRVSAIALVVSVVLGTSERLAVMMVISLTILYTFEGGMKAVIWTDVAQLLVYMTGSAITLLVLFHRIPGGWSEVTQVAAAAGHKLQFLNFSWNLGTKYTFCSGVIGGSFLTMAVGMSNASGSFTSLAASSVLDFAKLRGRSTDARQFLRVSRGMTLAWGLVLMGFGFVKWGPLLETGLTVASLPFGSLLGLFLLGTFDRAANARGAFVGMFAGLVVVLSVFQFTKAAYTWYFLIGACVTFFVGSLVSRMARKESPL